MNKEADRFDNTDMPHQTILNTPYDAPMRHRHLDPETGESTDQIRDERRPSGAYMPVPKSRKDRNRRLAFVVGSGEPYGTINRLRELVERWAENKYRGATPVTKELLAFWSDAGGNRPKRPYHAQLDAIRTLIWLHEAGQHDSPQAHKRIIEQLRRINADRNDGMPRIASKLATGTGKTQLMQMIMVWRACNSETSIDVLAIAPGLPVKERLQELKPHRKTFGHLVPRHLLHKVNTVRVSVQNYHIFKHRDISGMGDKNLSGAAKAVIHRGKPKPKDKRYHETDDQLLHRLLGRQHGDRPLIILNDEAHHCYRPPEPVKGKRRSREEKREDEQAALWYRALMMLQAAGRVDSIYDFSATPMYLNKPADLESELFPWTVSDCPLIDAMESGLTKIPVVPVADNTPDGPKFRNLYEECQGHPIDPEDPNALFLGAFKSIYEDYCAHEDAMGDAPTPPVMICVMNSIENANAMHALIAGREINGTWTSSEFDRFANAGPDDAEPTLLVTSDVDSSEEDEVRKIFSTVGQIGEPGERIRCVISVSMLNEGWDAKTVTHIFGYRAFGTQLLCEQVVGRGLRRSHFDTDPATGLLQPEQVTVLGIPFSFMERTNPGKGSTRQPYRVERMRERADLEIRFPRVEQYRLTMPSDRLRLDPNLVREFTPNTETIPTETDLEAIDGTTRKLSNEQETRTGATARLAQRVMKLVDIPNPRSMRLMQSATRAVEMWLDHPKIQLTDQQRRTPWILLADERIPSEVLRACQIDSLKAKIVPALAGNPTGSTRDVGFNSANPRCHETKKSHVNKAPCDSNPELELAAELDVNDRIRCWVRNESLGLTVPYPDSVTGTWRHYEPDFIAVITTEDGQPAIYLILEYKGVMDSESEAKITTTHDWWIPAVNNVRRQNDPIWAFAVLERPNAIRHDLELAIANARAKARPNQP